MTTQAAPLSCCIAGGGPAGLMLGLLLARAGVRACVLEKHADFLRDFRGDTIHPSTLEVVAELGLLEEFLRLPHQEIRVLRAWIGDTTIPVADFTHLPTRCRFLAMMPQWDFLDFLARHAGRYPTFALRLRTEATGLVEADGRVVGVRATGPDGPVEVRADLVVAADGRSSVLRAAAGLPVTELGAPMDVLWFRLSRAPDDPGGTMGRFDAGRVIVLIERGEHWQCGLVIPKGRFEAIRARGLPAFRETVAALLSLPPERVEQIVGWDDVKLLTVRVDRLARWWRPGFLCIGDAAHAMSPVGGVGINLAIQDAVAAANLLAAPLRDRRLSGEDLARVQRRRMLPTRLTQAAQVLVQNRVLSPVLSGAGPVRAPLSVRMLGACPWLQRVPARLVGLGVRPEHVRTEAMPAASGAAGAAATGRPA